ncbi:MAG TPA: hypothetical protein VGM63_09150 [Mucilaginibacter sp.]|jgi:hypothetical protein
MSDIQERAKLPAIPTNYLPKDWREQGAEKFKCSKNKIERIVYGLMTNPDIKIYEFFVELAEAGKREFDDKQNNLSNRVAALS